MTYNSICRLFRRHGGLVRKLDADLYRVVDPDPEGGLVFYDYKGLENAADRLRERVALYRQEQHERNTLSN